MKEKLDSLLKTLDDESQASSSLSNPPPTIAEEAEDGDGSGNICSSTGDHLVGSACPSRPQIFRPREQLMLRANSLKKAIRQIIEHTEKGTGSLSPWVALEFPDSLDVVIDQECYVKVILAQGLPHVHLHRTLPNPTDHSLSPIYPLTALGPHLTRAFPLTLPTPLLSL